MMTITPKQKMICKRITNFFENGTTEFQYAYIEDLDDGRGYTAGYFGCCSGTGDMLAVVEKYQILSPYPHRLTKCLPQLRQLAASESEQVNTLGDLFKFYWKNAARDKYFRKAQDEVCDELYWRPSQKYAAKLGITSAVGSAILYDTIVQHGDGDDEDSIGSLIKIATRSAELKKTDDEYLWLNNFLAVRHHDLLHPSDKTTQKVWAESAERVSTLLQLLNSGNADLKPPFEVHCFGNVARFV